MLKRLVAACLGSSGGHGQNAATVSGEQDDLMLLTFGQGGSSVAWTRGAAPQLVSMQSQHMPRIICRVAMHGATVSTAWLRLPMHGARASALPISMQPVSANAAALAAWAASDLGTIKLSMQALAAAEPAFGQALAEVAQFVAAPQHDLAQAPTSRAVKPSSTAARQILPGGPTIHLSSSYIRDAQDGCLRPAVVLELEQADRPAPHPSPRAGNGAAAGLADSTQLELNDRIHSNLTAGTSGSETLPASPSRRAAAAAATLAVARKSTNASALGRQSQSPALNRRSRHAPTPGSAMPPVSPVSSAWVASSASERDHKPQKRVARQQIKLLRAQAMLSTLPCIATLIELPGRTQPGNAPGDDPDGWPFSTAGRVLMQNSGSVAYWGKISASVETGAKEMLMALFHTEPVCLLELWEFLEHQQRQQQQQQQQEGHGQQQAGQRDGLGLDQGHGWLWERTVQVPRSSQRVSRALQRRRRRKCAQVDPGTPVPVVQPAPSPAQPLLSPLKSTAAPDSQAFSVSDASLVSPTGASASASGSVMQTPFRSPRHLAPGPFPASPATRASSNSRHPETSGVSGLSRHPDMGSAPSGHLQCILSSMAEATSSGPSEDGRRPVGERDRERDSITRSCSASMEVVRPSLGLSRALAQQAEAVTAPPEVPVSVRRKPPSRPSSLLSILEGRDSQAVGSHGRMTIDSRASQLMPGFESWAGMGYSTSSGGTQLASAEGRRAADAAKALLVVDGRTRSQPNIFTVPPSPLSLQQQQQQQQGQQGQRQGAQLDTPPISSDAASSGEDRWRTRAGPMPTAKQRSHRPGRGSSGDLSMSKADASSPGFVVKPVDKGSAAVLPADADKVPQMHVVGRSNSYMLPRSPVPSQSPVLAFSSRNQDSPSQTGSSASPGPRRFPSIDAESPLQPSVTTRALKLSMLTDPSAWQSTAGLGTGHVSGSGHASQQLAYSSTAALPSPKQPGAASPPGSSISGSSAANPPLARQSAPHDAQGSNCSLELVCRTPSVPAFMFAGRKGKASGVATFRVAIPEANGVVAPKWQPAGLASGNGSTPARSQDGQEQWQQLQPRQGSGNGQQWPVVHNLVHPLGNARAYHPPDALATHLAGAETSDEDEGVPSGPAEGNGIEVAEQPGTAGSSAEEEEEEEPDMRWHDVNVMPMRDPATGKEALLVTQTDVTERHIMTHRMATLTETQLTVLENMFPRQVLEYAVGAGGGTPNSALGSLAFQHEEVTILFMDIVGFTSMSKAVQPAEVMQYLNSLYNRLDNLCEQFGCYKVDTAGDCYILAGALMMVDEDGFMAFDWNADARQGARNVVDFAQAALRIARAVPMPNKQPTSIRVGIHTGSVVSGLLGTKLLKFSLFGDTMNTSSRMESTCKPGCIQMSEATYSLLEDDHKCLFCATGGVEVKGKGLMATFVFEPDDDWVPLDGELDVIQEASETEEHSATLPGPSPGRLLWEPPSLLQLTRARLSGRSVVARGDSEALPEPLTPTVARSSGNSATPAAAGGGYPSPADTLPPPLGLLARQSPRLHSSPLHMPEHSPLLNARRRRASLSALPTPLPVSAEGHSAEAGTSPGQQAEAGAAAGQLAGVSRLVPRSRRAPSASRQAQQGIADVFRAAAAVIEHQEQHGAMLASSPTRGGGGAMKSSARRLSMISYHPS